MRKTIRSRSLVGALLGVMLWAAAGVGAAGTAHPAPVQEPVPCISRLDEAYIQTEKQQVREAEAQHRRELEDEAQTLAAQRQEEAAARQYRAAQREEAARKARAAERIADLVPEQYQMTVVEVAERFEVDPRLVAAIGQVESGWYAKALGTHGDSGLMQILPGTGQWIASSMGLEKYDLYDPVTNLTMGTWYLRTLYDEYGSWETALAAYNGGPKGARLGASHPYTRRVMSVYNRQGT